MTDPLTLIVSFYGFVEAFARHRGLDPDVAAQSAQGDGNRMSDRFALTGARIFDGDDWHDDAALVVHGDVVEGILPVGAIPSDVARIDTGGGMLAPGFVDLQVNGGGGVMLNDHPDVASLATICRAHAPFGTTALLATLITDTPEITAAAIAAGTEAARQKLPGFLGLHLEGPHLSIARKGAHDPALIRPMTDADQAALIAARKNLPVLLTTIAPESVEPARVAALAKAGVDRQPRPFRHRLRHGKSLRRSRRQRGHASVQRDEPDRQPRAGAGRCGHRHRHACPPG